MWKIFIYVNARRKRMPKRERHKKQGKYPNYINIFVGECVRLFLWLGDFLKSFFMLVCIHSDFDSIQSQFNSRHAIYNA